MKSVHYSNCHTSIRVHGKESLYGRTTFLSTGLECSASLLVNVRTFRIKKARWEIYRGPVGPLTREIEGLAGVEAYLGSGNALRQAVLETCGERALSLISETVRGFIQAETFVYTERGYKDAGSYDDFWEKMYQGTCRYYSNLGRAARRWADHVGDQERFSTLFNRFKNVSASSGGQACEATASLSDSFHEVGLNLTLDKSLGTVTSIRCGLLRAPDPVCFEAGPLAENLLGKKITQMSKKEIASALGGGQGCVHIIDICSDTAAVLQDMIGAVG